MGKKYHIETFGCQMNKCDSELIALSMEKAGYAPSGSSADADIAIFNTCSVRQHAEDRAVSRIMAVRTPVRQRGGIIAVTGCMAQRIGGELLDRGTADIVIGPYQSPDAGNIIRGFMEGRESRSLLSQSPDDYRDRIQPGYTEAGDRDGWHRWVTITHGCENFCTYCIVPHVRGKLISSPSENILSHVREIAEQGIMEITLLGQNVNQYGQDSGDIPFCRLLEKVAGVPGFVRVNFLTSHPMDFSPDLVRVIRDNPVISRAIHLPLQSGSDAVLRAMNRHYDMKHYYSIIDLIKKELDRHSLSTDLIVGFPGEEEKDFRATLEAVEKIGFDDAFMYAYSPRENTPAWGLTEDLSHEEKIARLQELIELQRRISRRKLEERVNSVDVTIVERVSKKSSSSVMGKTSLNHPVVLPGSSDDIGKRIHIKIHGVKGSTLQGTRIAVSA